MNKLTISGIKGQGFAFPETLRTNDDPVFDWLKDNNPAGKELFTGYDKRFVLLPDENLMTVMVPAAKQALAEALLEPQEIDYLLGYGSLSEYLTPNALNNLHAELNLAPQCSIIPIANEFNNFNSAIVLADSLIKAQRAKNILIVMGAHWTKFMDYHSPVTVGIGDGAGAIVMSHSPQSHQFQLVDFHSFAQSSDYGAMYVASDKVEVSATIDPQIKLPVEEYFTSPYFHLTSDGQEDFQNFGLNAPAKLVNELLEKNNLQSADITLMSHQASSVLTDTWGKLIKPGQYINTIAEYGNVTLATLAINFASKLKEIKNDYLVFLSISGSSQTMATLFKRG